jgi:hypothetical protein
MALSSYASPEETKKAGPPSYKSAWKMELPTRARRIASADVMGDKRPRLLVLGEDGTLVVNKVAAGSLEKEAEIALGPKGTTFVAGRFAKERPAIIAAPGAIYYREGEKFVRREASEVTDITGTVQFVDGSVYFFFFDGGDNPNVWGVDLSRPNPLTTGREMVPPEQGAGYYAEVIARLSPGILAGFGLPAEAQKPGLVGLCDPRGDSKLYALYGWESADGSYLVVVDYSQPGAGPPKPVWRSPKLAGRLLDMVFGADPQGSHQKGILVLQAIGEEQKGRLVEFFALE